MSYNPLIYGKSGLEKIVGMDIKDGDMILSVVEDGEIRKITHNHDYYVITDTYDRAVECERLNGKNDLQYYVKFRTKGEAYQYRRKCDRNVWKYYMAYNDIESSMLRYGFTMYKGMEISDLSILSFDIETVGVKICDSSFVTLITNTFRDRDGSIKRRTFAYDDYDDQGEFLRAWCKWVREVNPDIMTGHNIFGFDFPYLKKCADMAKIKLHLGRDVSIMKIDTWDRKFRKDGSQTYQYNNVHINGRQVIDTFFLALKYDTQRKYPSYGLKAIVKHEKMDKADRQYWDFSTQPDPTSSPALWKQFKQYAEEDADDSLKLFDLMAPAFFYYTQSIPKTFQEIINTATGSQVNSFMMRSYIQNANAVPLACERESYEGAISIGNPGLYKNIFKIDVASLYPSIMLQYNVFNYKKDPDRQFLAAVEFFTKDRLENKRLAAETGQRKYLDMSNAQKIMINSFYGFMGAAGLNFNYPEGAAQVTEKGREILQGAIDWCAKKNFRLANADTDSISYEPTSGTIEEHLVEVNALTPDGILWTNDGIYESGVIVKAKNYAFVKDGEIQIKGSALKATMKETALRDFLETSLDLLLAQDVNGLEELYGRYARDIAHLEDISPWCSKKTITDKVLNPKRTNEQRVLDALKGVNVQEGDKVRMFYETDKTLCLEQNFKGEYDMARLHEKLFKTVKVLAPVLDIDKFPNYKLKKNVKALEEL